MDAKEIEWLRNYIEWLRKAYRTTLTQALELYNREPQHELPIELINAEHIQAHHRQSIMSTKYRDGLMTGSCYRYSKHATHKQHGLLYDAHHHPDIEAFVLLTHYPKQRK
jgi:hypothetical protein